MRRAVFLPELWLFLALWFFFGLFIRQNDLEAYNLQQMGPDAIVEHGTFGLGLSQNPRLQPLGDVFSFNGRLHAAKQPGQFALGALAYVPLHWLGLTYDRDYLLASAWVTWLSATSFAAGLTVVCFALLYRVWAVPFERALLVSAIIATGTPIFAYSGVAHHDVIAAAFLLLTFYFAERARQPGTKTMNRSLLFCGAAGGFTLFISMLPSLMVLAILIFASLIAIRPTSSSQADTRLGFLSLGSLAFGFAIGISPLAIHNWVYFGSPFMQANVAGRYSDTFFNPSWQLLVSHLETYLGIGALSVWLYAPAAGVGVICLFSLIARRELRKTLGTQRLSFIAIIAAIAIHFSYLFGIETIGHCQYGARYLLPAYALMCVPLAFVRTRLPLFALLAIGIFIGVSGALGGTMNCDLSTWLPLKFLNADLIVWPKALRPFHLTMAGGFITILAAVVLTGRKISRSEARDA